MQFLSAPILAHEVVDGKFTTASSLLLGSWSVVLKLGTTHDRQLSERSDHRLSERVHSVILPQTCLGDGGRHWAASYHTRS